MQLRAISSASPDSGHKTESVIPILFTCCCRQSCPMLRHKLAAKTLLCSVGGILFSSICPSFVVYVQLILGAHSCNFCSFFQEVANWPHHWLECLPSLCQVSHRGSESNPLWLTGWFLPLWCLQLKSHWLWENTLQHLHLRVNKGDGLHFVQTGKG